MPSLVQAKFCEVVVVLRARASNLRLEMPNSDSGVLTPIGDHASADIVALPRSHRSIPRRSTCNDMAKPQGLCGQLDLFFYTGEETSYEDLTKYKRNGLHPIMLGDILPKPSTCVNDQEKRPRYRIMLNLAFGHLLQSGLHATFLRSK